jgi:hypothetical protein
MCRNIKQLRSSQDPPSEEAIEAAARQYIRKISGYRKPSHANQAANSDPNSSGQSGDS